MMKALASMKRYLIFVYVEMSQSLVHEICFYPLFVLCQALSVMSGGEEEEASVLTSSTRDEEDFRQSIES
jgi:hypothetical protein